MTRLKNPLSVWLLRVAFLAAAATVIPACGRAALAPLTVAFSIDTSSLAGGVVGVPYAQTLTTVSQTDPVAWSLFSGSLPPGLSLGAATGAITGTPTGSASSSTFTVRAIDALGQVAQRSFQLTITGGVVSALTITTTSPLPGGDLSTFYDFGFSASGGAPGYTWVVLAGALPTGLTLNPANGGLSGTPTVAGLFNFTIRVTDTALFAVSQAFTLTIAPALTITSSTLPPGTVGGAYTQPVPALGGTAPLLYSLSSGTLPAGLVFNPGAGTVTGTPTLAGSSTVVIRVTDAAGVTQLASLSITINPAPIVTAVVLPPSTQGLAYSQTLAATLGTGAYTWAVSGGALPGGLALSAGGVISGTSTAAGNFNFTVTVTDAANGTGSRPLSILINPPVVVTTTTLLGWTDTRPGYSQTLAATGGTGALTWTVSVGTLPTGLTLNPATGVISGTPTGTTTVNFTVLATDTLGASDPQALSIVMNALPVITTATLPDWTQNLAYTPVGLAFTGGTAPFVWSVTVGGLPAAMTLGTGTGIVGGTPSGTGTSNFTIQMLDAAGAATTHAYTIVINAAMVVTTATPLPQWTQSKSGYSQTLAVSGGTGAKTWSGAAGLPAGITMNSGGVISGTPTAAPGTYNFNAVVTDSVGATANKSFDLQVNPPVAITSTSPLAPWTQGQGGYSVTLTSTGGTGTKTWSITSGTLPAGLSLAPATGVISGLPTAAGTSAVFVQATDTVLATAPAAVSLSITINLPLAITSSTPLAPWTQNQGGYSQPLTATGGTGTQTWLQTGGTLPTGLTFNSSGSITGAPTAAPAIYTIFVQVTDTTTATAPAPVSLSITVNAPLAITSTSPLAQWTQGLLGYNVALTATGGTGTRTWSNPSGALPGGLSLSSAGVISGTPSASGVFNFNVQVTDTTLATAPSPVSLQITINAPVAITTTSPLAQWTQGQLGYSVTLASTGGTGGNTWTIPVGTLPAGLTMTTAGVISGLPTAAATSVFSVQATDTLGATAPLAVSLSITINPPLVITSTSPLAAWTQNFAGYNQPLTATGGTGTKTWLQTSGTLPTGLTFNSSGSITGTPTDIPAVYTIFVQVTDTTTATAAAPVSLSITINPPLSVTTATPMAQWTQGLAGYNQTVAASGGTGSQTWSLSPGPLPTGLSMDSAGAITGTPSLAGTYNFTVLVTDAVGATGSKAMTIVINLPPSMTTTSPLAQWTQNHAGYSVTLVGAGGTGGLTWSNPGGGLPAGLSFLAGVISGTPTGTGTSIFNLQLTDGIGATTGPVSFSITINLPPSMTTTSPLAAWTQNHAGYGVTLVGAGGTGGLTWSNPGGGLPAGLTLTAGVIGGTPTGTGTSIFNLQLTDGIGATTGTVSFSITINPPVAITLAAPFAWTQNKSNFNMSLASTGGTGAISWIITSGGVPAGLTFNSNGTITGTPTDVPDPYTFFVQATDTVGATAPAPVSFTIQINPPLVILTSSIADWTQFQPGYSQFLSANGGTGAKTWSFPGGGSIPVGLSLNSATGEISGTPTSGPSNYAINVQVTDGVGATAAAPVLVGMTLNAPLNFSGPLTLQAWTINRSGYSASTNATGGTGTKTWSNPGGGLALTGLSLNAGTGAITGTPNGLPNVYSFDIRVTDGTTAFSQQTFSMTINQVISITTNPTLADGVLNSPYTQSFLKSNGTDPVTWTSSLTVTPIAGLTFLSNGLLSGTPTTSGTFNFSVTATDTAGSAQTINPSLFILAPLTVSTGGLPGVTALASYAGTPALAATGGRTPYSWSLQSGAPPTGISFDSAGVWSGSAPDVNSVSNIVVKVTDVDGRVATQALSITVTGATPSPLTIVTSSLQAGTQNAAYTAGLTGSGGTVGSYAWSIINATLLPGGLSLNGGTGAITGTPTGGSSTFDVQLFDGTTTVSTTLTITINPPLLITSGSTMAEWTVSAVLAYPQSMARSGGTAPFTWTSTGSLPTGLTLNTSGSFSGTPTSAGTYFFTAQVTDAAGATANQLQQIKINPGPLVNLFGLIQGTAGFAYPGATFTVAGGTGTGPLTWTSTPDPVVTGLSVATNGVLGGTPGVGTAGTTNPSITVTDAAGVTNSRIFSLTINPAPSITTVSVPSGNQGSPYPPVQLTVSGGSPPMTWLNPAGLPTGMSVDSSGILSGTPTGAPGTYPFTVQVNDSGGGSATKPLSIDIVTGPTVIFRNIPDNNTVGRGANLELQFSVPMDQSTFTSTGATPTVTLSPPVVGAPATPILFYWNAPDRVTLVFDTQAPAGIFGDDLLDPGTLYTVTLTTGIKSDVGSGALNLGATFQTHFSTYTGTTNPTFTLSPDPSDPLPAGTTTLTITFSEKMDFTQGTVRIEKISGSFAEASVSDTFPSGGFVDMVWNDPDYDQLTLTLNPGLPANALLRFQLDSFRSDNNSGLNDGSEIILATPGPAGAPQVTGILPTSAGTVSRDTEVIVAFTAPMWPADLLDPANITVTGTGVSGILIDRDMMEFSAVQLRPRSAWPASTVITVTVKSTIRGANGTAIGGPDQTFTFTTNAGDATPFTLDVPYSSLATGVTDIDVGGLQGILRFVKSGTTRSRINRQTLAPQDITLRAHDSPFIPMKGYQVDADNGLQFRSNQDFTGMDYLKQYDLILNPTLQDTEGVPASTTAGANILTFTTRASSLATNAARPAVTGSGETRYQTDNLGRVTAELQFNAYSSTGATLNLSATDSPDAGFTATFPSMPPFSGGNFNYSTSGSSEPALSPPTGTPGNHELTYTLTDGAHTVTLKEKAFVFDSTKYPILDVPITPTATPTLTWAALDPALGAQGMAIAIMDSFGNLYVALLPPTATSFTVPADQALSSGPHEFFLHFFHAQDGVFEDASSEADSPSAVFVVP